MAEEIPISDVLCNATEYLCKLGSNLRSRSENLKEKRMGKDKLKNAHAVRKAATKLLLMCDLSKKSLDNVEISVRRVLEIVDSSRCSPSVGAKTKTASPKTGDTKKECFYIEYDSCKLRISKKILLEHYTTAKVLAKCMPSSVMDKYPVYYKCSLYQKRKKSLTKNDDQCQRKEKSEDESGRSINNNSDKDLSPDSDVQESSYVESVEFTKENQDKTESARSEDSSKKPKKNKEKEKKETLEAEKQSKPCSTSKDKEICPNSRTSKESEHKSSQNEASDQLCNDKNESNKQNLTSQLKKPNLSMQKAEEMLKEKSNKREMRTSSDSTDRPQNLKSKEISKDSSKTNAKLVQRKSSQEKEEEKDKSEKSRKSKFRVRFLDDSSDDDTSPSKNVESNKRIKRKPDKEKPSKAQKCSEPEVVSLLDDDGLDFTKKPNESTESVKKTKENDDSDSKTEKKSPKGVEKTKENEDSSSKTEKKSSKGSEKTKENEDSHSETEKNSSEGRETKENEDSNSKNEKKTFEGVEKSKENEDSKSKNEKKSFEGSEKTKENEDGNSETEKKSSEGREKTKENEDSNSKNEKKTSEGKEKTKENEHNNSKIKEKASEGSGKTKENEDNNFQTEKRPLIKLVSLNKLLKPDILEKKLHKSDEKDIISKCITKTYENKKQKKENEYLMEKKKEVLAFKPKKFDIVVTRLPLFTDNYLCKYGLKKIIQHGSVIYKLTDDLIKNKKKIEKNDNTNELGSKNSRKNKDTIDIDSTDDSNKNKTILDEGVAKTKHVIQNSDSDSSECNKNPDISSVETAQKKPLPENSDPENSREKNAQTTTLETQDISETLNSSHVEKSDVHKDNLYTQRDGLDKKQTIEKENNNKQTNNSPEPADPPKTPKSKDGKTNQTTPRSKRKLIMESMHAKKMLLTYSSSSDTDDEQLRNALKDIKNSLLNGSSSDEEINVKKKHRQLATPTDSDDSLKIYRRQNKRKKNIFAENDDEASSVSQVDGINDEKSNSSSSQMGRSKTKVSSSSNQSSENVDSNDIEINRLSNLNSLNRPSRRRTSREARSSRRMPKAPPIPEEMLPPVSSGSEEVESEAGDAEELPPIPVQEFNGDGINHLAKEDLLAQSDSSSSHDKANGSEEDKKDESDEEQNVKSRRRKPNALSSDSEAGSSRRKDKISDFEDSEDDSEPRNKSKRKKKISESDGSLSSNDGSKKKRRRIKQVKDSDGSGSDTENEGKNKHGRKNIRKVMSKDQLEEATKKAARREKERVARIAERQKTYNNVEFDETGKPDEVVLDKVVLDFDPETKEPLIQVDRGLVRKLKPHQANGIKFMWNACFESVKRIKKDRGSGCILAHCMGLGKTLQVVSLTHTLLVHSSLTNVKRVLVVCPLSTVLNWVNEFTMWLKHAETEYEVDVFELSRYKQNSERAWQLQQWVDCGGVCVLGYEMFRNLSADNNKKFKKKMLKTFQEALVDPGPDLVVCDEGHLLKNEKTSLSQSMNRVRTLRRIVLTGTPLQNNLKEYYCMVQFVKPNLLGKYNEYLNRFVNPITNGQYTDSTERDISIMKRRSHVLHTMLDGAVQRRDYGVLAPFLPPKHEFVLFITLTDIQTKLYQHYLDNYSRRPLPGKSSGFLFPDFQSLQRIWTHPLVLKYNSERYEIMQQKKRDKEEEDSEGSLADFIDDESTPEESSTEESSDDLSDLSDDSRKKSKKKKSAKKSKGKDAKGSARRGTRANPIDLEEDKPNSDIEEVKYENPTEWWMKLVTDEELEDIRHSHKLLLLFDILRQCDAIGDKLLVFSQSLYSLDLIEHFLGKVDEATQEARIDEKLAGHVGSWSPGVDYFRLDGSTSCENRSIWCKNFNREDNPRARLFLISTRAGGLGINLVAANRVVIFDVSWNPSHDVQSIFRVYRFGQKKPCYIYRFLAMGTMEEKIYERQVTKQAISKRVIDEQQIDRHYAANDLAELYRFEPVPATPRPTPPLPKDRLFAELLKDRETAIFRFHEHDSLLENKEEETLSEEERKRAWEEFENEKRAPPPAPFPNTWAMTNGMAASLLQQQQQQLAYAALAAMIRKDMPNISDNQIRDMLPIICNANPGMFGGYDYGLMQKMNEIYKYAQPGMMNPSMMNPVMNPGGAGGMSTSSSLQYEPPWQRQHQQQQQMRLQQLMQQQQSMGAKYYAGGLGSRDPVAMALQQQRAREFLLGGGGAPAAAAAGPGAGAGRPRGRPPLQPRAPPAAADVVNLADSD